MNPINTTDTNLYEQLGLTRPAASTAPENELGADAFLTLMLAQLRNQDPLQPMENGEFLSQLAQFNTVTGIQELQGSFEGVAQGLQSDRRLAAAALVDRQVLVPSTQAKLAKDVPLEAVLQLNTPAERVISFGSRPRSAQWASSTEHLCAMVSASPKPCQIEACSAV